MQETGGGEVDGWSDVDAGLGDSAVWTISPREKDDAPRRENLPSRGAFAFWCLLSGTGVIRLRSWRQYSTGKVFSQESLSQRLALLVDQLPVRPLFDMP